MMWPLLESPRGFYLFEVGDNQLLQMLLGETDGKDGSSTLPARSDRHSLGRRR